MTFPRSDRSVSGAISIFFSASLFGLFWIPLHYFDESGLKVLWAVMAINFAGLLIALPATLIAGDIKRKNLKWLIIVGAGMGISNVLYFAGIILSDVVRVVFLFYLLPLWATFFSWLIFGEKIGKARIAALFIAAIGIWLLLGAGGWPIPQNLGDVFGLLSGAGWAFGLAMIRGRDDLGAFATTASGLFFAFLGAAILGSILMVHLPEVQPPLTNILENPIVILVVMLFGVLILWPSLFGQIWGAQFVAATTAALLTMSEIMLATISTYVLGESNMELISWIGATLILAAIFIDLFGSNNG